MIRFTVVDRLIRLACATLSQKECVYMMYLLGVRNGVHPSSLYIIAGNEGQAEQLLRAADVNMGVVENVYTLPDNAQQVSLPSNFNVDASTLRVLTREAERIINRFRTAPAAWIEAAPVTEATESDAIANIIESRVWAEVGVVQATPRSSWTEADEELYRRIQAAYQQPEESPSRTLSGAALAAYNRLYPRLNNDYNNRRR